MTLKRVWDAASTTSKRGREQSQLT